MRSDQYSAADNVVEERAVNWKQKWKKSNLGSGTVLQLCVVEQWPCSFECQKVLMSCVGHNDAN